MKKPATEIFIDQPVIERYVIVSSIGSAYLHYIGHTKTQAINNFMRWMSEADSDLTWRHFYNKGWRCVKVELTYGIKRLDKK